MMANYGRDYTEGRYTRRDVNSGSYDDGYRGSNRPGWGFDQGRDRYAGGQGPGRYRPGGSGGRGRGESFGYDSGYRPRSGDPYRGQGGRDFQSGFDDSWSPPGYGWGGSNFNARSNSPYGGPSARRPGGSDSFGRSDRYDSERNYSGRQYSDRSRDYDEDLSDRLRRGWNRFRDEARDWMGRGDHDGW